VPGDRVQLQQVLMKLTINGIDAMKAVDRARQLAVKSQTTGAHQRFESGFATRAAGGPDIPGGLFDEASGAGMGLSISRSIIESHGGRLRTAVNLPRGASFCFILPTKVEAHE
jgi:C4-dicarboxylate-specific signal transduction histidine kinase